MISKCFKTLIDQDGQEYIFDDKSFKYAVKSYVSNSKKNGIQITSSSVIEEMAKRQCVSQEAIKNWMYGYNGPTDMDAVKTIADVISKDYMELLRSVKEEDGQELAQELNQMANQTINNRTETIELLVKMNKQLGEIKNKEWREENMKTSENTSITEKEAIREIYHEFVKFMEKFRSTQGFCDFEKEVNYYETVDSLDHLKFILQYHMLEIPQTTYDALMKFYECNVYDLLDPLCLKGDDIFTKAEYFDYIKTYGGEDNYIVRNDYIEYVEYQTFEKIRAILVKYIPED